MFDTFPENWKKWSELNTEAFSASEDIVVENFDQYR